MQAADSVYRFRSPHFLQGFPLYVFSPDVRAFCRLFSILPPSVEVPSVNDTVTVCHSVIEIFCLALAILLPVDNTVFTPQPGSIRRLTMQHKVIEFLALAATGAAFGALLAWGAFQ